MEIMNKEELFDDELCGMVKFEDETKETPKPEKSEVKNEPCKPAERKKENTDPVDAKYEPAPDCWLDSPIIKCVKWFVFFAGLEYVVFYWMQTGQMAQSAAMPSMIACALLAGLSVGKNWKWRK